MNGVRDIWALVHDWRYTGKSANATDEQLWFDACADLLEKAIEASDIVPRSRLEAVEKELAQVESEMAVRGLRAAEATASLLAAVEKSKKALMSGQIGHVNGDMGVYHLEGQVCGAALDACRDALAVCNRVTP